jgi:RNAse (barnase) inhibitor barstar
VSPPSPSDRLAAVTPPWVHLLVAADDGPPMLPTPPPGVVVRVLDGRRCRTKQALLAEMARGLGFPAHFGGTWDALEDCLTDLDWLPATGYRLVILAADRLLRQEPASYATLVALLEDVGRAWGTGATGHAGRRPVPFHTVLVVPAHRRSARADWGVAPLGH